MKIVGVRRIASSWGNGTIENLVDGTLRELRDNGYVIFAVAVSEHSESDGWVPQSIVNITYGFDPSGQYE